ncbi:MAG: transcriptional repressor [Armatimonadetes bacterium]|nr:transcriptional repressor [Armatimonadota bacterium]
MTLNETLSRLKGQGVKITPQRLEILKVLLDEERYYSAEEILKKVQESYPAISYDTVYRTLYLFKKLGLVLELNFQGGYRRFEFNRQDRHHHHLVCLKCGCSQKLSCCPTDCLTRIKEEHPEFAITSHSFEIYGYCEVCRKVKS